MVRLASCSGLGLVELGGVEARPVGHRQHVAAVGVHDDGAGARGRVLLAGRGDRLLGAVLDRRVDRQLQVLADAGLLDRVEADRRPAGVVNDLLLAVVAAQRRVLGLLQAGQALVLGADGADHLRGQRPLRIEAAAVGQRRDALDVQLLDAVGLVQADLLGEVGEAGLRVRERLLEVEAGSGQDRGQPLGRARGVLDLVRRRDHGGGVLGDRQDLAVPVEHAAALAGDRHGRHLLGARVGAQLAALHPLQPGGAGERHAEQQHEAAEDQAQAPVDQPHGASATGR